CARAGLVGWVKFDSW
nr:immunoglobulin heavy chain junction region [Macaca mulatta]MOW45982.1 immunoglobulin heavy chain junction region [Macaca mulatta]MOW45990.1 immunoglobulin heavy chain junction region [Macaca mulatta]MOW46582.1 immunoglobulin heavy chain junction region [Macaca mulatta]MOW47098.1 immunoglobulin heavy chain junction region [Macaca mulatta]